MNDRIDELEVKDAVFCVNNDKVEGLDDLNSEFDKLHRCKNDIVKMSRKHY